MNLIYIGNSIDCKYKNMKSINMLLQQEVTKKSQSN